jgi:hypothetical protein
MELGYIRDLKSLGVKPYGFDSRLRHQLKIKYGDAMKINFLFLVIFLMTISSRSEATPITYSGEVKDGISVFATTEDGNDWWWFAGQKDDVIDIRLNRVANLSDGTGTLDPVVTLFSGKSSDSSYLTYLTYDDDSGSDTPAGPWKNSFISNFVLPSDGLYSLYAQNYSWHYGPYELNVVGLTESTPVPEPASFLLFMVGVVSLISLRFTKK